MSFSIKKERTKYNVSKDISKRTFDGIKFDSEMEMRFYKDIILPYTGSGHIVHYELQKPFELQPKFQHGGRVVRAIEYVADFYLEMSDGHRYIIDVKGLPDSVAKLKRKMMFFKYPDLDYRWITHSRIDGGWVEYEAVKKARKLRREKRKKEKTGGHGTEN